MEVKEIVLKEITIEMNAKFKKKKDILVINSNNEVIGYSKDQ